MTSSLAAVTAYSAACRSLSLSAEAIRTASDDHPGLGPEMDWSTAEHAARLALALDAIAAEVKIFGVAR